jgi:hypothetical protein
MILQFYSARSLALSAVLYPKKPCPSMHACGSMNAQVVNNYSVLLKEIVVFSAPSARLNARRSKWEVTAVRRGYRPPNQLGKVALYVRRTCLTARPCPRR